MNTVYDSPLLMLVLGLLIGMWGPPLLAWMISLGEQPPRGRTALLRELMREQPRKTCAPRQRGRHGQHRVR